MPVNVFSNAQRTTKCPKVILLILTTIEETTRILKMKRLRHSKITYLDKINAQVTAARD